MNPQYLDYPILETYDDSKWAVNRVTGLKIKPLPVDGQAPVLDVIRNVKYDSPCGERRWQIDCAECNKEVKLFKMYKARALSKMMETLSPDVIEKMGAKMNDPSFEDVFRMADLLAMWTRMKQITIGAGDQSFNVDLKDLITMKMKDNNWGSFIDKWKRNKVKIEQRNSTDADRV